MGLKYWHGSHTKHRLVYHIVFLPKYRKRILRGKIAKRIIELFYQACRVNNWWIDEIHVMPDHVHFLIQIQSNISLSKAVNIIKDGSSRILRKEFEESEEFLWGESFWSDGYFAETVGRSNYEQVKRYIQENQETMPQETKNHGL